MMISTFRERYNDYTGRLIETYSRWVLYIEVSIWLSKGAHIPNNTPIKDINCYLFLKDEFGYGRSETVDILFKDNKLYDSIKDMNLF